MDCIDITAELLLIEALALVLDLSLMILIAAAVRISMRPTFTGHGSSYHHMSREFAIGATTACSIAHEVARAIIDELHDCAFPTVTFQTWLYALDDFRTRWDHPAAIGALDGKHTACVSCIIGPCRCKLQVCIVRPRSRRKIIGRDIFMTSSMKTLSEESEDDFPSDVNVEELGTVPCHFLVDQGSVSPRGLCDRIPTQKPRSIQEHVISTTR
ncbi:hypothetical protein Q1695_003610 [Nippostrongylus brasiliensis]|nr:hypothetical protein Q1695_003610 [Nippostrongylus brasiliensis]